MLNEDSRLRLSPLDGILSVFSCFALSPAVQKYLHRLQLRLQENAGLKQHCKSEIFAFQLRPQVESTLFFNCLIFKEQDHCLGSSQQNSSFFPVQFINLLTMLSLRVQILAKPNLNSSQTKFKFQPNQISPNALASVQ